MSLARTRIAALSVFASLILSGCATPATEKNTKTNRGPGTVIIKDRGYVCYTDFQLIDGEITPVNLCGISHSGFTFGEDEPQIWAGTGHRMPGRFQLSEAIRGTEAPVKGKRGLLKCDPVEQQTSTSARETFCKVTFNGQVIVSARIIFEPLSDKLMGDESDSPLKRPVSALVEFLQRP